MRKKKVLFVIDSLTAAGAEKSLVTFLSVLDYSRFEVDLQLFKHGGEFERFIPDEVNLLPPLSYTIFLEKRVLRQITSFDFKKIFAKVKYSIRLRLDKPKNNRDTVRLYWESIGACLKGDNKKEYDIGIAYAQGIPTFYVVDCIKAKQKFGWINVGYGLDSKNSSFQERFYRRLDKIITVSDSAYDIFSHVYPQFKAKMHIIWDMLDANLILNLSKEEENKIDCEVPSLLTIARLDKVQKGYDMSLEACKILRDRGIIFKWYAIGQGTYKEEMLQFINKNNLQNHFILLGVTPNPYPYLKDCTLYVQTSRFEGYGLSIAEARILNKPVVTTEFDAVYNQMIQGKNGIVVPQDSVAIADAIEKLLKDKELYNAIVEFQKQEKKGNTEEIEKFYQLVGT